LRVKFRCISALQPYYSFTLLLLPFIIILFLHSLSTNHKCTQPCYFPLLYKPTNQALSYCGTTLSQSEKAGKQEGNQVKDQRPGARVGSQPRDSPMNLDCAQEPLNQEYAESAPTEQISPLAIYQETHSKGQKLQEILKLLKQATSSPLSGFLLQTPEHKLCIASDLEPIVEEEGDRSRKSPRLKKIEQGREECDKNGLRLGSQELWHC
jgi:hypothetical protein